MKAFFTRADDDRLGLRFEPVTFEEQLLLETFTRCVPSDPHVFQFSSWEHNHPRTMREGLTSCWGQLTRTPKEASPPAIEAELAALDLGVTRSVAGSAGAGAAGAVESRTRPSCVDEEDAGQSIVHAPKLMQVLREVLDKWQALAEGMRSTKFQPPSVHKLERDLERISLLRQLLNTEEHALGGGVSAAR